MISHQSDVLAVDVSDSNVYMEAKTVVAEADAITKLSLQETDQNQALQEDPSKEAHKGKRRVSLTMI